MLILSLKAGETVHVGGDVVVTNASGRNISLGFEAPDETRILRGSLVANEQDSEGISDDGSEASKENTCNPSPEL